MPITQESLETEDSDSLSQLCESVEHALAQKRVEDAIPFLKEILAIKKSENADPEYKADTYFELARTYYLVANANKDNLGREYNLKLALENIKFAIKLYPPGKTYEVDIATCVHLESKIRNDLAPKKVPRKIQSTPKKTTKKNLSSPRPSQFRSNKKYPPHEIDSSSENVFNAIDNLVTQSDSSEVIAFAHSECTTPKLHDADKTLRDDDVEKEQTFCDDSISLGKYSDNTFRWPMEELEGIDSIANVDYSNPMLLTNFNLSKNPLLSKEEVRYPLPEEKEAPDLSSKKQKISA